MRLVSYYFDHLLVCCSVSDIAYDSTATAASLLLLHAAVDDGSPTDLPGNGESADRRSASTVAKISSRANRVPGQSRQCSSVCGAWPHLGQFGSTELSIKRL